MGSSVFSHNSSTGRGTFSAMHGPALLPFLHRCSPKPAIRSDGASPVRARGGRGLRRGAVMGTGLGPLDVTFNMWILGRPVKICPQSSNLPEITPNQRYSLPGCGLKFRLGVTVETQPEIAQPVRP